MIQIDCRNVDGWRRAFVSEPYQLVGQYLETDIQDCVEECEEMLRICDNIEEGKIKSWGGCGNANEIVIEAGKVTIEVMFVGERVSLSLNDFRLAIESWRQFICSE